MSLKSKKELASKFGKQENLQALIIADDFITDLKPASKVYPTVLLPVVTTPLLNYILDTLLRSKVHQVFVYCSKHVEKLKLFIDSVKNDERMNMLITPIISDGCRSLGDALRDVDTKGCIRGDFILIRGSAFASVNLRPLMDLHRARKEKDKNAAMTMLFRNLGNVKESPLQSECAYVVSNVNSKKLLYYKKITPNDKEVELELEWFLENDKVQINSALIDSQIYICSQSVLPLFTDNFDFQTMEDFIRGVLINEEFMDSRIYWEPLTKPAYALPISSWKTYKILCRDILLRHSFPLAPDSLPVPLRNFIFMPRCTYKHCSSTISKGSTLQTECLIGEDCTLEEDAFVTKAIIGPKCHIGKNVHVDNCYVYSEVTLEEKCLVTDSIIFPNCTIGKNVHVRNCVLLPNVVVSKNCSNSFIEIDDSGNLVTKNINDCSEVSDYDLSSMTKDENSEEVEENVSSASSVSSECSSPSNESRNLSPIPIQDDNEVFLSEVLDSLLRGFQDKVKCENLILEINSSRYAYNVSMEQVSFGVIKAIFKLPFLHYASLNHSNLNTETQSVEYHKILKSMLIFFQPIIVNYVKTKTAQDDCLRAIQDVVSSYQEFLLPCLQNVLHYFYDNDILFEEKIVEWYEQNCDFEDAAQFSDSDDESTKQNAAEAIKKAITPFINWLKEAEEDSSSS